MRFLIIFILLLSSLFAKELSIIGYYIDKNSSSLNTIKKENLFKPYKKNQINLGLSKYPLYLKIKVTNNKNKNIQKLLIIQNPRIQNILLFDNNGTLFDSNKKAFTNVALFPNIEITLPKNSTKIYYLKLSNKYTDMNFALKLLDSSSFIKKNTKQQHIYIFLLSAIIAFLVYGFTIYFYSKDRAYLYYSIYLLIFVIFEFFYKGVANLYLSKEYVEFGFIMLPAFIGALVILVIYFAINFLKLHPYSMILKTLKFFIAIESTEAVIFSNTLFYNLYIPIITATIFILYKNYIGIYSYTQGNKNARFFILGFGLVSLSYLAVITDLFAFSNITNNFPYLILIVTIIEIIILLVAFFKQHQLLELNKTYINEIHHRVKNNLELIISIIDNDLRLNKKLNPKNLKNRIYAIAETYKMLTYNNKTLVNINEYINSLINLINKSITTNTYIKFNINIDKNIEFDVKKSINIGLIINETVTNSFKYAFKDSGTITITLMQSKNSYTLKISDNGTGFNETDTKISYGITLIKYLVKHNLNGTLDLNTSKGTNYTIRF